MIGAIIGDVVGSIYEHKSIKTTEFELLTSGSRFTDDTVLTIAIADALVRNLSITESLRYWGQKYPHAGYGNNFDKWLHSVDPQPYDSWGNGSAMRVSPVGFAYDNFSEVLQEAKRTAEVTHNHPEGIKGAQSVAAAIYMSRTGHSKEEIKTYVEKEFGYNLSRKIKEIRPDYSFDVSCQGSVPEAIIAFLESTDYEEAIRLAVSLGGDSDTIACITGGISQAYYGAIPEDLITEVKEKLPEEMLKVIDSFENKFLKR